jgi:hypothetical protein
MMRAFMARPIRGGNLKTATIQLRVGQLPIVVQTP